jgi:hypothetical protein
MDHPSKPSKKFLIRAGITAGALAIFLLLQTNLVKSIFSNKTARYDGAATVGELVGKDSNGNGITDWEERLWGLDPTILYTNGVPNKQIIEEKKKSLGITSDRELNETDLFARDLFALSAALGQNNQSDAQLLQNIVSDVGTKITPLSVPTKYFLKNIKTVPTSTDSLQAYKGNLYNTLTRLTNTDEVDMLVDLLDNKNYARGPEIAARGALYLESATTLSKISVPTGVAAYHLDIINALNSMGEGLRVISEFEKNPLKAGTGVPTYNSQSLIFTDRLHLLEQYFDRYTIL